MIQFLSKKLFFIFLFFFLNKSALAREKSVFIEVYTNSSKKKANSEIEIGRAEISLDKLPLNDWFPILSDKKDVKGIIKVNLFKVEVPNSHILSLPRGAMALALESNITTTIERQTKMEPIDGNLNEIQAEANKAEPNLKEIGKMSVQNKNNPKLIDVAWKNGRGQTLMHLMAMSDNIQALQILVQKIKEQKERIDIIDNSGWTPLHVTAVYGSTDCYEFLVNNGASKTRKDWNENNCLHLACTFNRPKMVKLLLKDEANSVDDKDEGSCTPLHKAAHAGKKSLLVFFFFESFICKGSIEIAKMLLEKKCFINAEDRDGNNPLLVSLINKNDDLSKFLIQSGADASCENNYGDSAFWISIYNKSIDILNQLLDNVDFNINKSYGKFKFNILQRCYLELDDDDLCLQVEKILMEKKIDINYQNSFGKKKKNFKLKFFNQI